MMSARPAYLSGPWNMGSIGSRSSRCWTLPASASNIMHHSWSPGRLYPSYPSAPSGEGRLPHQLFCTFHSSPGRSIDRFALYPSLWHRGPCPTKDCCPQHFTFLESLLVIEVSAIYQYEHPAVGTRIRIQGFHTLAPMLRSELRRRHILLPNC